MCRLDATVCVVLMFHQSESFVVFFFNDTATTEIYTLSLHDALLILRGIINCRRLRPVPASTPSTPRSCELTFLTLMSRMPSLSLPASRAENHESGRKQLVPLIWLLPFRTGVLQARNEQNVDMKSQVL